MEPLKLIRPDGISDNAFKILEAFCKIYHYNGATCFNFDDMAKLNLSHEEQIAAIPELESRKYLFWYQQDSDSYYLHANLSMYSLCRGIDPYLEYRD